MEKFSILTYNIKFNQALTDVPRIIKSHSPDIICLQEVALGKKTTYREFFPGYILAATSNSFYRFGKTFGLANFYKEDRFFQLGSRSIILPKTNYELFLTMFTRKGPRTALCTDLISRVTNRPVSVCNLHLTSLVATNSARNKQLREAIDEIEIEANRPHVILGDLNYPFRKKGLEKIMNLYGLQEATSGLTYTYTQFMKVMKNKLKFDYVLYKSLQAEKTLLLEEYKGSDHYPVLSYFLG